MSDVYVNNIYIGTHDKAKILLKQLKKLRRNNEITRNLNVRYDEIEDKVEILTKEGRARRPLIVVENGASKLTEEHINKLKKGELDWDGLIKAGVIEYLDADEEENALIALDDKDLTENHTHLEISPSVIVGAMTAMIPFAEYNQAPRVSFGSKLQKQGIGLYAQNFHLRQDTDTHLLHYPQRPIVDTAVFDYVNYDAHPVGQNVVIITMSYEGYNMHDAIIINKASIERGLFRSTFFKPYKSEELKYAGGQIDIFEIPDKEVRGYKTEDAYSQLEEDGLTYPEAVVNEGDVIIGKTSPPRFLTEMDEFKLGVESRRDASIDLKKGEEGIVDQVIITESEEGNRSVKVKIRMPKIPEIGDKFATRHGQKGILGIVIPQEEMPFTEDGIIPDVIFSPHSIPGRMTVSQILEIIAGKLGALKGEHIDGTIFEGEKEENIRKQLKSYGYRDDGAETVYDGVNGREIQSRILIGNIYYMKLKYLVSNKLHSRSRGPMQLLTRQPTEGRAKEGGLKLGEMEKDVLIAHGASLLLKERFDSDKTDLPICTSCGLIALYNKFRNEAVCSACKDSKIKFVEMSYAFKLLLDELRSLGIHPRIVLKPKKG